MAVSKRTRYEVLRRDNFTCRYCRSTDGALTVDHVTPVALGGSDEPSNLAACCKDCNAGKASTSPDAATVADVDADALRWSQAIAKAAEITEADARETQELGQWFAEEWLALSPQWADLPRDYAATIAQFQSLGLSRISLREAIIATANRYGVSQSQKWRYFCGICWNKIRALQQMASQILAAEGGE